MARLVTRLELVRRMPSRSKSQIYRDCEKGGDLYPALMGAGGRNPQIDLDHQAARIYCATHAYEEPSTTGIRKAAKAEAQKKVANYSAPPPREEDFDLEYDEIDAVSSTQIMDMTLREITARYGRNPQFKDYVTAGKTLLAMRGMEEEQERKRGEYIHRAHAEKIIAMIDTLHTALLTDVCTNAATSAMALVKAGESQRRVEEALRAVISRTLRQSKDQLTRSLRNV